MGKFVTSEGEGSIRRGGTARQQIADVIGVNVKTLYKYLPAS
ncbi:TPA: helix-turn-helix domain-containing protein [Klebsiella pneumoniae]